MYCYPCPNPCVSVYRTVTQPSGSLAFSPVDSGLDTNWTEPYARARVFSARGGHGGLPAPPYMRKHFTNLCRNLWDALQAPRRALREAGGAMSPTEGRRGLPGPPRGQ